MKGIYMKMIGVAVAALMVGAAGFAQDHGNGNVGRDAGANFGADGPHGQRGPHGPGGPRGGFGGGVDKSRDTVLQALLAETVSKYQQFEYKDEETGETMQYNLFVPEGYDASQSYPLMLFIGDASTAGKEVTVPLTQGYGGVIWASAAEQAKHPSFVLVPQYKTVTVNDKAETTYEVEMTIRLVQYLCGQWSIDTKRLYTTGQSMGGMMSMYFNVAHPKFFAASLYAGCQWDTSVMAGFATDNFIYGVAGGDERASAGMASLRTILENEGKTISSAEWSAKLPAEEQEANVKALLSEGNNVNFIVFTKGSVLPEDGRGMEHMCSFDYVYRLEAARDWIYSQKLD